MLAEEATEQMEAARTAMQRFLGAADRSEVVFTRGTTEAVNLVANCIDAVVRLGAADEILLTELEHHSNIVPWQLLAQRTGAELKAVRVTADGELDLDDFHNKLGPRTRIVALNHISNALGTINPVAELIAAAREAGAVTLIDGAQATLHANVDVLALGCDFYACSGHKMFGPTGIGVLYGRRELLDAMPPWHGGGEMIEHVTLTRSTYQAPPYKFEAGTPHIAGIVGLGAAVAYIEAQPQAALLAAEDRLLARTISGLNQIPGVHLVGEPSHRAAVVSFSVDGAHPHDIGTLLNQQGVAVRTGHHCAMPLMEALGIPGTVRASFSWYNNDADVERLLAGVAKATTFL